MPTHRGGTGGGIAQMAEHLAETGVLSGSGGPNQATEPQNERSIACQFISELTNPHPEWRPELWKVRLPTRPHTPLKELDELARCYVMKKSGLDKAIRQRTYFEGKVLEYDVQIRRDVCGQHFVRPRDCSHRIETVEECFADRDAEAEGLQIDVKLAWRSSKKLYLLSRDAQGRPLESVVARQGRAAPERCQLIRVGTHRPNDIGAKATGFVARKDLNRNESTEDCLIEKIPADKTIVACYDLAAAQSGQCTSERLKIGLVSTRTFGKYCVGDCENQWVEHGFTSQLGSKTNGAGSNEYVAPFDKVRRKEELHQLIQDDQTPPPVEEVPSMPPYTLRRWQPEAEDGRGMEQDIAVVGRFVSHLDEEVESWWLPQYVHLGVSAQAGPVELQDAFEGALQNLYGARIPTASQADRVDLRGLLFRKQDRGDVAKFITIDWRLELWVLPTAGSKLYRFPTTGARPVRSLADFLRTERSSRGDKDAGRVHIEAHVVPNRPN